MLTDVISPLNTVSSHIGGVALAKGFSTFVASIHSFLCEVLSRRGLCFRWMLSSIPHRRRLWHCQQEIQLAFACWVLEESPRERGTLFEWSWVLEVAGENFRMTQNKGPVGGLAAEQKGKAHLKGLGEKSPKEQWLLGRL